MNIKNSVVIFFLMCFATTTVLGGGIDIIQNSVTFNGYPYGQSFKPSDKILLKYLARHYSYSGGGNEYFLFRLARKTKIIKSVGLDGVNDRGDVKKIQAALKDWGFYKGVVNGVSDNALVDAIKLFQLKYKLGNQDGKVDPGGITIRHLTSAPQYFIQLARDGVLNRDTYTFSFETMVKLPAAEGEYFLMYHRAPIFSISALGILGDREIELNTSALQAIEKHLAQHGSYFDELGNIHISNEDKRTADLYLQVNGKVPGLDKFDLGNKAVKFSWYTANIPPSANRLYRFRLYPLEEWSFWEDVKEVEYFIIERGSSEFQVECKYRDQSGEERVTNAAKFSLFLEKPFLAEPNSDHLSNGDIKFIDKGDVVRTTNNSTDIIGKVYDKSTALIIGVDSYDDQKWQRLPYINNDLAAVNRAFTSLGFAIKAPAAKKRNDIMTEVRSVIQNSGKNDRLIIYISSHGFIDPLSNKPLIASQDCMINNPGNCLSISELKDLVKTASAKIRHVLLILDCCTSGVGVMDKNAALGGMKSLATQGGTHVLAAGMGDQSAKMGDDLRMSYFTYFLTKGLTNRTADYTHDGIVTLTELLIYVQYNVATKTKSEQVPTWGRVSGYGEMIFN